MIRRSLLAVWLLAAVLLCGCEVHQFPEPKRGSMLLHLQYEPDFWVWEHRYDPSLGLVTENDPDHGVDPDHPGTSARYDATCGHGTMRTIIRAFYPDNLDKCIREYLFAYDVASGYDRDVELDLEAGDYVLAIWSDLCERETDSPYYDASDFRRLRLLFDENYSANTDHRDGYRGRIALSLDKSIEVTEPERFEVTMRRPMAKFEFITTDLSEFLDNERTRRNLSSRARIEDYRVEIRYAGYLPSSYSIIEDRLENAATGIRFDTRVQITGETEASLGFDHVLINDTDQGAVLTEISVYDLTGERVAHSHQISVPLRRDHHTILRGAFFTMQAKGGVGIDPGYDGDHNITYH